MSGERMFKCYLARTKHGKRLVYFEPQDTAGKAYLISRSGAKQLANGIWVSCEPAAANDSAGTPGKYTGESFASLLARMLVEHNDFHVHLMAGPPPSEPSPDAPGFGFRLDGEKSARLFTRERGPPPAVRKKSRRK